ncbi:uncharacterized protein [Apostichopus japonicus]|uniref:uncharacterized protein isoform X2 n=1 Tax=Stichopus japonicus TaxID=307972 RepID=UPI003AB1E1CB
MFDRPTTQTPNIHLDDFSVKDISRKVTSFSIERILQKDESLPKIGDLKEDVTSGKFGIDKSVDYSIRSTDSCLRTSQNIATDSIGKECCQQSPCYPMRTCTAYHSERPMSCCCYSAGQHHPSSAQPYFLLTPGYSIPSPMAYPYSVRHCRRRKARTVFSDIQHMELEKRFKYQLYLSTPERIELAEKLDLTESQVKTWFQNRRMKAKKMKQSKEK